MSGAQIAQAVTLMLPIVDGLIRLAESTGASGVEKHQAVASAAEAAFNALQASGKVRELDGLDWAMIEPIVVPVAGGLISIIVSILNSLGTFISSHLNLKAKAA